MSQRPLDAANIITIFHHALYVTSILWVGGIAIILLALLMSTRRIFAFNLAPDDISEPRSRTYLRWSFGALWLIDGILQFQPSMPLGLANNVVAPAAVGTPSWLHSLMLHGISVWNSHPITLAVGVAWFQVGLGLVILVSRGRTSRFAGTASAAWAGLIWLVGNGAGGVFISGASLLFGWPGASLFYVIAGVALSLDQQRFLELFSRLTLRALSVLLMIAALLQALPSAEFWHGGPTNALAQMTRSMSAIAQPHWLAAIVRGGGSIAATMGGGFNIVVILWLMVCAVGLWMARQRAWRWPVWTLIVGAVAFWVIAEDTAVFGGVATDLNSLIPLALLVWTAAPRDETAPAERFMPRELTSATSAVVATFASSMLIFAAISMGLATSASAENTLFLAQNGPASAVDLPAKAFTLTDQSGRSYTLGEHKGRVTLLTFLDPHCWTDCPLLANQLAQLRSQLALNAKLDIVAVAADPYYESLADVRHFMKLHGLDNVRNFYFVTGPLPRVRTVWRNYGVSVSMKRTAKMSIHSDLMFIITPSASTHWIVPDDPIASTSGTSSAVSELKALLALEGVH
jgi:cytochrome oxidase Cu insertion factor (SCO1/SenC/PrrC family)